MERKSTEMPAGKVTTCCQCAGTIEKGTIIKVYAGIWLHIPCYNMYTSALHQRRKLNAYMIKPAQMTLKEFMKQGAVC